MPVARIEPKRAAPPPPNPQVQPAPKPAPHPPWPHAHILAPITKWLLDRGHTMAALAIALCASVGCGLVTYALSLSGDSVPGSDKAALMKVLLTVMWDNASVQILAAPYIVAGAVAFAIGRLTRRAENRR